MSDDAFDQADDLAAEIETARTQILETLDRAVTEDKASRRRLIETVRRADKLGVHRTVLAARVGVNRNTITRWCTRPESEQRNA